MISNELLGSGALWLRILLALAPVLVFLLTLLALDSFRLMRPRQVFVALLIGGLGAVVSYLLNTFILSKSGLSVMTFALNVAPAIEELVKGAYLVWLLQSRRVGFLVDGAIFGFALGAGFSLIENMYYLKNLPDAPLLVWLIRGFGTAIMHGGATAVFALLAVGLNQNSQRIRWWTLGPAILMAALLHSFFNRTMNHPILVTALLLVILPLILRLAWFVGEKRLRTWLGEGFDRDSELLALINQGQVRDTPLGQYLESLRDRFRADTVADMLCLLRLQTELSIRAKGQLLLVENGLTPPEDPELKGKLAEVRWLEGSVGRTGLLAMRPVSRWGGVDQWQRHLLAKS